jgi:hypothetical protein
MNGQNAFLSAVRMGVKYFFGFWLERGETIVCGNKN